MLTEKANEDGCNANLDFEAIPQWLIVEKTVPEVPFGRFSKASLLSG